MQPTTTRDGAYAPELWGIKKVSNLLGCSSKTIYRRVAAGMLAKPVKDGPRNKWPAPDVLAYLERVLAAQAA